MKKTTNLNFNKVTIIMLIVTMIALIALSGTYAKYTTTTSGTGSVVVAKWAFDASIAGEQGTNLTVNLYDTMTTTPDTTKLSADRVAPGTKGSFAIEMSSNSEVGTNYTIAITPQSGTLPGNIVFKCTGLDGNENVLNLTPAEGETQTPSYEVTGTIDAGTTQAGTVKISWEWPYDSNDDIQDTQDGIEAPTCLFDIAITGTQVTI